MAEKPIHTESFHNANGAQRARPSIGLSSQPFALESTDADKLSQIVEASPPLKKGTHLFLQGDPFMSIFTVRAGTLKTYTVTNEGEEQITGFYFPGEVVALSGIGTDHHPVSAKTLETTTVLEYPYIQLEALASQVPQLRTQLTNSMGKEIRAELQMMLLLSKKTAEQRVATFLCKLSDRFKQRGYSATVFRLSMSRNEIGNYLGLAVETVSRIFTRFQKQQLINVEGKEIEIVSLEDLFQVSGDAKVCDESPGSADYR
ncbi:fumarate/nitrate reduction transcriptional regulator Fnr [Motiliproteus sp. MSK22-1]|uniref:fumarate/nitrate reduction transcriptional regulator Fnr n=1 Tax=Motiliproteus sp. MSK22-1 TaxID=1897630 RepID=UPI0009779F96|nr:fumarate/nitrate reduction transcriptional regulator Fnr [Motiliproteus sp. MSK22-1]OMH38755.1 transcriptional regulator [Motiliproteus sp. MSK22-1]